MASGCYAVVRHPRGGACRCIPEGWVADAYRRGTACGRSSLLPPRLPLPPSRPAQVLDISYNHIGPDGAALLGDYLRGAAPGALAHLTVVLGFNKLARPNPASLHSRALRCRYAACMHAACQRSQLVAACYHATLRLVLLCTL